MSRVMGFTTTVITPPAGLPVDFHIAQGHLRTLDIAPGVDDLLIESWIAAATQYVEEYTGRPLLTRTYEAWLDTFPVEREIELPHPPLVEVVSVSYVAADGTLTSFEAEGSPTLPAWEALIPSGPYARRATVRPKYGASWPTPRDEANAVRIRYRAGYGTSPSAVPDVLRAAILLMVGSSDRFRSGLHISEGARVEALPFGVDQMLQAFKYTALPSQVLHRW